MRVWRLFVGASVVGVAGAVAVACSSSSSGGGGTDAGEDASEGGGEACTVPASLNVASVDAGSAWACVQRMCTTELTACGKSCDCNGAVVMTEACIADGGAAATVGCFASAFVPVATDPAVGTVILCLQSSAIACGGVTLDGGTDGGADAPASDAPASDAPASDAPASDAPASDAPASDAPTG